MFVLVWAILLLSVSRLTAGRKNSSGTDNPNCNHDKSCTMSNEGNITAESGLCVVIPCTAKANFEVKSIIWHKCNESFNKPIFNSHDNENIQPEYKGRVSLLQPDLNKKNCSIIINNLTKSDSGSYFVRVTGNKTSDCTILSKTLTVTGNNSHSEVSFHGEATTEETKTLHVTCKSPTTGSTKDLFADVLNTAKQLPGIIVFLIGFVMGILLSTIITCLVIKCLRKKPRRSRFLPENMELVIAQSVPDLMDVGPTAHYDVIRVQDEGGAESSGPSAPDGDMRPKEVEYSNIDFSRMKTRNPTGAEETWGTAETEYAEIKKEAMEDRPDTGGEDGEVLEGNEEEKVVMIGEDEEAKQGMAAEEDVALYSNVKEVMDEV
ncbi:uncharacterized protein LOC127536379 [Acanthochromis polyacanthus]|uniref:uncharacterized protein LOC127536379 n=1 Tax=Acanthochromis polyacanthus TaxID=80966 RepID=UPI002234B206|nr:uncharacterized protein LOC127536379 [Acanthochromis polyacanthus]